ncbi:alpha/beta hydrolase [Fictibacillus sp. B-59209]|uniref:alpha/beta fold hydrolase n=1 Tax=Fictibacillus sp. B-59209 TaxID=3024873 RepID=UPI002E219569|nr:alpha/beta hydrolase [Fictibacillus sp. B-59209]
MAARDVHTSYRESGSGLPLVFIHPPALTSRIFKYQHEGLNQNFKVITYDMRGHGNTLCREDSFTIGTLSDDLLALLDKLEIEKAILCGYSAGGTVAQDFVLRYPERVRALVLSGGFPQVASWFLEKEFRLGIHLAAHYPLFLINGLAWSHKVDGEDRQEIAEECKKGSQMTWRRFYEESMKYSCTESLPEIQVPLLLFYGSRSFYFLPYKEIYQRLVPHTDTIIVPGAFHQIPVKQYRFFNHALTHWAESVR